MILQGVDSRNASSFSLKNRVARVLWGIVYVVFFLPTPRPCHAWRRGILRAFGAQVGAGAHIYPRVRIWAPWNLSIGALAGVANGVTLYSMEKIVLGERCVISQGAHLCTGSHDFNDPMFQLTAQSISIGREAWICAEAFICPGAEIAEGVVVGARSVVTRSLRESWTVYAGMPARKISIRTGSGEKR